MTIPRSYVMSGVCVCVFNRFSLFPPPQVNNKKQQQQAPEKKILCRNPKMKEWQWNFMFYTRVVPWLIPLGFCVKFFAWGRLYGPITIIKRHPPTWLNLAVVVVIAVAVIIIIIMNLIVVTVIVAKCDTRSHGEGFLPSFLLRCCAGIWQNEKYSVSRLSQQKSHSSMFSMTTVCACALLLGVIIVVVVGFLWLYKLIHHILKTLTISYTEKKRKDHRFYFLVGVVFEIILQYQANELRRHDNWHIA